MGRPVADSRVKVRIFSHNKIGEKECRTVEAQLRLPNSSDLILAARQALEASQEGRKIILLLANKVVLP